MMPDEIERCDETWINKMLVSRAARIAAQKATRKR
jgi:hypothetical protein